MPKGHPSPDSIATHAAHITTWWAGSASRRPYYTPQQLEKALGTSMRALAGPMELCGWHRGQGLVQQEQQAGVAGLLGGAGKPGTAPAEGQTEV